MRRLLVCAAFLASLGQTAQLAIPAGETTPGELAVRLRSWADSLKGAIVPPSLGKLPAAWQVRTAEGVYSIPTSPLRQWTGKPTHEPNWIAAAAWMNQLVRQLESYDGQPQTPPSAKSRLHAILNRAEFAPTAPPGYLAEWQKRFTTFIQRMMERLFGGLLRQSRDSWKIFYLVLGGVLVLLGYFAYRLARNRRNQGQLSPPEGSIVTSFRPWEQWLQAARAAASEGDLRKAIQCAYWTGVTRLQEVGDLPQQATHTPREYLRVFKGQTEHSETLRMLTTYLERVWYGRTVASMEDVQTCLSSLEALGCRAE